MQMISKLTQCLDIWMRCVGLYDDKHASLPSGYIYYWYILKEKNLNIRWYICTNLCEN